MLAHWIEEDGESQLSLDSRENIKLLRKRIVRLDALLNGLLQYAKVGRVDTLVEDVDTGATIREIIDLLPNPHDLEIRVEGVLPKIQTFRAPFAQVIRNVVGNAIEHHGGTSGLISICAIDLCNGFVEFRVSDDGRGIDEAFHERVFRIFETINKRDLHESSGVGLAMVKSIVESVGGKVRLESALSRGTCVFVTWPKDCAPAVVEAA